MRYAALTLTLLLLIFATPLSASWWPKFSTTHLQMYVGEKTQVTVTPTWSGLVDMGGVHWAFATDNPAVATGSVRLDSAVPQEFEVVAVSPGGASIRRSDGWEFVTITVTCPPNSKLTALPAEPVVHTEIGRAVQLAIVTESDATFAWYVGSLGDTSRPLGSSGARATYIPESNGSQYIWAAVTSVCSAAQVQFRIDVSPARQRAVRH